MKVSLYASLKLMLLTAGLLALGACEDVCQQTYVYTLYEPVYMTREEMRAAIKPEVPVALEKPGKIYLYGKYLLINEVNKGIHVFNNANPKAPQALAFISIPGNVDMAVKDNILYADNATDLIALDISNPAEAKVVKQVESVFPVAGQTYPGPWRPAAMMPDLNPARGVIVDWVKKEERQVSGCDQPTDLQTGWTNWNGGIFFATMEDSRLANTSVAPPVNTTGIGGSMARFTIAQDHLYTVDNTTLRVFAINQAADPQPGSTINVGWNIETIFPYKNNLFIGSQTGMFIFDASNPAQPVQQGMFSHLMACDPVVVDDKYAYVTLRSGTFCRNTTLNQLDVVDIRDLRNPKLVKSYPMQNPHGLGKDGNTLFVCDGKSGLKVYDATDINTIDKNQLAAESIHSYDIIPFGNIAIVIGEDGLYQYDYSDPKKLRLLSKIAVNKAIE